MSAAEAHEATQLVTGSSTILLYVCNLSYYYYIDSQVSCSKRIQPCPRNVFVIGRYDNY